MRHNSKPAAAVSSHASAANPKNRRFRGCRMACEDMVISISRLFAATATAVVVNRNAFSFAP